MKGPIRLGPIVRKPEPPTNPEALRQAAERIRAEINAGRLGHAVVILRSFAPDDRDRLIDLLERRRHPRGQAMVEFALVTPLFVLLVVGGMMVMLAALDRQARVWEAQQAATVAAAAGAEDSACLAALEAVQAVSGRSYAACDGRDGLVVEYEPPAVTITIRGGSYPVPFLDDLEVSGSATALMPSVPAP